jgi:hypothetical protein
MRVPIDIDTRELPGFNVRGKIVGNYGINVKHILQMTGVKVQIRGRGSGYTESNSGVELDEPMFLSLTCGVDKNMEAARKLCEDLVKTVRMEYERTKLQVAPPPPTTSYRSMQGIPPPPPPPSSDKPVVPPPPPPPPQNAYPAIPPPPVMPPLPHPSMMYANHMQPPPTTAMNYGAYYPPYYAVPPPPPKEEEEALYLTGKYNHVPPPPGLYKK